MGNAPRLAIAVTKAMPATAMPARYSRLLRRLACSTLICEASICSTIASTSAELPMPPSESCSASRRMRASQNGAVGVPERALVDAGQVDDGRGARLGRASTPTPRRDGPTAHRASARRDRPPRPAAASRQVLPRARCEPNARSRRRGGDGCRTPRASRRGSGAPRATCSRPCAAPERS